MAAERQEIGLAGLAQDVDLPGDEELAKLIVVMFFARCATSSRGGRELGRGHSEPGETTGLMISGSSEW